MAPRPLQVLRELALSVERAAAEEAASGVVKGAAEGLREELPEVDRQLRLLLRQALASLTQLADSDRQPGELTHTLAAAAMRGALEELEREWQDGGFPLQELVNRINGLLDWAAEYARRRSRFFESPDEIASGLVQGITDTLHERTPQLAGDLRSLGPVLEELAFKAGRGLVSGAQSRAREDPDALAALLEQAGSGLIRGLSSGVASELRTRAIPDSAAVAQAVSGVAEEAASASVRGASQALRAQLQPQLARSGDGVRELSRQVVAGALDAVGQALRRARLPLAGAGGALAALALLAVTRR